MPSYPAKPYVVPHDDWFNNNNTSNFEIESIAKGSKNITTIHEFFYRQSHFKVGGSDNLIQINSEKKSIAKIIIPSQRNFYKSYSSRKEEKYSYSKIPKELKSIKKRSFEEKTIYKNLPYKKIFDFKSHLLNLKSIFIKIITRRKKY